jgi:predicted O-methyltransferase YrrM
MDKPKIHCQNEYEQDRYGEGFISDGIMMKWFNDRYSSSKHLLTLYAIAKGLDAKKILEVGFGRSTPVLARAAFENGGKLLSCDLQDFSHMLTDEEKKVVDFYQGLIDKVWSKDEGYDFAFLDYFSDSANKKSYIIEEVEKCVKRMKKNGIIVIHDVFVDKYKVGVALEKLAKNRKDLEYVVLPFNYGLGILRCKSSSPYGSVVSSNNFIKKKNNN